MPTLDERVAYLEGRVEEHARNADGMREALVHLEERIDRRFEGIDRRFEGVDARLALLENTLILRFDAVDTKIGRLTTIVVTAVTAMLAITGGALLR